MVGLIQQISMSRGGELSPVGILGDIQKNTKYYGGPRQALLWITAEGYPGALGASVTTPGVGRRLVRLGQQWRLG